MIDAIPEGYTTLPAAVTLLAATIAEVDVARTRPMRRPYDASGFLLLETPSNDNSDDDPFAVRLHKDSVNSWEKRELAISKLQSALNTGELEVSVRIPESGVMFTLEPADWRGAAFRDQIIRGGVIRSSACESIERHAGRRVLISKIDIGAIARSKETAPACCRRKKVCRLASGSDARQSEPKDQSKARMAPRGDQSIWLEWSWLRTSLALCLAEKWRNLGPPGARAYKIVAVIDASSFCGRFCAG